ADRAQDLAEERPVPFDERFHQAQPGRSVAAQRFPRPLQVRRQHGCPAVVERMGEGKGRRQPLEPVAVEPQTLEDGRHDTQGVNRAADVVAEAGQRDLFGPAAAPDALVPLDDEHGQAGARQHGRGREPVRAGADHDDVPAGVGHAVDLLRRRSTLRVLLTGGNPFLHVALASTLAARGHEVDLDRRTGLERPSGDGARTGPPGASPDPDVVVVIDRSVAGHGRSTLRWGIADDAGERGLRAARAARRVVHVESRRAASPDGMPDWLSTARGAVTTIRTSLVYGTGIDPVTQLLIMMRSLPVVPLPPGRHTLRPLWRGDLERIVAAVVERSGRAERIEVTGPEVVGWRQLAEALGGLIDRDPVRVAL